MKAAVLRRQGEPLAVMDIQDPRPKRGEVLIRVKAAGVCHTDLHIIKGDIPFPTPAVLGHEVSGEVVELGDDVQNLSLGDKVVGTFIIPCGNCSYCMKGREDLCTKFYTYNRLRGLYYDGDTRLRTIDGERVFMYSMAAHAEYSVVPETALFRVPAGMALDRAAVVGCAIMTAYGACKNATLKPGETVAVFGVGGVGSSIVQIANGIFRSTVIAIDLTEAKLRHAEELGASYAVDAREDPAGRVLELTGGEGVDVAFEAVGSPKTIDQAIRSVRAGGRVVVIGLTSKEARASFPINQVVRRGIQIIGSYGARPRYDMPEILDFIRKGLIKVEGVALEKYNLEDINQAFERLEKREIKGRAVVVLH